MPLIVPTRKTHARQQGLPRPHGSSAGFTLVELLVVIAIIFVFMALVLPAVQQAREAARRSTCSNNQRQLARAAIDFESIWGCYPGYANIVARVRYGTAPGANKRASWAVMLLPHLERKDVFDLWNDPTKELILSTNPTVLNPDLVHYRSFMVCPSSGKDENKKRAANSYVSNNGFQPRSIDPRPFSDPQSATSDWIERSANGIFIDRILHSKQSVSEASLRDGEAFTLLFSESLTAADWHVVSKTGSGMVWLYASETGEPVRNSKAAGPPQQPPPPWARINGRLPQPAPPDAETARPSSNHGPGVMVAYADGRTTFLHESIDYHVYQALLTPRDQKSDMPNPDYVFRESDLDPDGS